MKNELCNVDFKIEKLNFMLNKVFGLLKNYV